MQCIDFTFLFLKKGEINLSQNKYYFVLGNTIIFPQKTSNTVTVPSEHQDHSDTKYHTQSGFEDALFVRAIKCII